MDATLAFYLFWGKRWTGDSDTRVKPELCWDYSLALVHSISSFWILLSFFIWYLCIALLFFYRSPILFIFFFFCPSLFFIFVSLSRQKIQDAIFAFTRAPRLFPNTYPWTKGSDQFTMPFLFAVLKKVTESCLDAESAGTVVALFAMFLSS